MSFVIQRNSIIVVFMVFVACASNAQTASGNHSFAGNPSDSTLLKILINNAFWTHWGPFSTVTDFAEINFKNEHQFLFKRGRIYKFNLINDTVIYESNAGIWFIKDSVITMIHSNPALGMIENQLKVTHLTELSVINFSNLIGNSDTFIRKLYTVQLRRH